LSDELQHFVAGSDPKWKVHQERQSTGSESSLRNLDQRRCLSAPRRSFEDDPPALRQGRTKIFDPQSLARFPSFFDSLRVKVDQRTPFQPRPHHPSSDHFRNGFSRASCQSLKLRLAFNVNAKLRSADVGVPRLHE
jgi:hypothetical protein